MAAHDWKSEPWPFSVHKGTSKLPKYWSIKNNKIIFPYVAALNSNVSIEERNWKLINHFYNISGPLAEAQIPEIEPYTSPYKKWLVKFLNPERNVDLKNFILVKKTQLLFHAYNNTNNFCVLANEIQVKNDEGSLKLSTSTPNSFLVMNVRLSAGSGPVVYPVVYFVERGVNYEKDERFIENDGVSNVWMAFEFVPPNWVAVGLVEPVLSQGN